MAASLSADQLLALSERYTQLAVLLEAYENAHAGDDDVDLDSLQELISQVDDIARTLANTGLATLFDDSQSAYSDLTSITQNANQAAASLAKERNQFSRIAGITAGMIGIATALGTGNAAGVFTAITACAKAANS